MKKFGNTKGLTFYFTIGSPVLFKLECNKNCIRAAFLWFSIGLMTFDVEQMLEQSVDMMMLMKEELEKLP